LLKDPSSQSSITRDQLPEVFNNAVNLNRGRVEPRLYGLQSAGKFADGDYLRGVMATHNSACSWATSIIMTCCVCDDQLVDSSCIKPLMGMKLSELNEPSAWEYDACMKDTAPMMTAYLPADFVGAQFKLLQVRANEPTRLPNKSFARLTILRCCRNHFSICSMLKQIQRRERVMELSC